MAAPILIGIRNPLSPRPEHALAPFPTGSTGHRLYLMIRQALPGLTRAQYMSAFVRLNMVPHDSDEKAAACKAGAQATLERLDRGGLLNGARIVCLGAKVSRYFAGPGAEELKMTEVKIHGGQTGAGTFKVATAPHPSGRCRFYNDPRNRARVGLFLAELLEELPG